MDISVVLLVISHLAAAGIGAYTAYNIQDKKFRDKVTFLLSQKGIDALSKTRELCANITGALQSCIQGGGTKEDRQGFRSKVEEHRLFTLREGQFLPRDLKAKLDQNVNLAETLTRHFEDADSLKRLSDQWHESLEEIPNLVDKYLKPLHDFYDRMAKG